MVEVEVFIRDFGIAFAAADLAFFFLRGKILPAILTPDEHSLAARAVAFQGIFHKDDPRRSEAAAKTSKDLVKMMRFEECVHSCNVQLVLPEHYLQILIMSTLSPILL